MSASTGAPARWARGAVVDWTMFVSRGMPDSRDRVAEVVSDLWEESAAADRDGRSSAMLAVSLLLRAVRGAPSDLARRTEQRAGHDGERRGRLFRRGRSTVKAWVPLADLDVKPFDQTAGALSALDAIPARETDADGNVVSKAVAANFFMGGGTI